MHNSKKIAVIIGGTGYVGSAIARQLANDGFFIILLSRPNSTVNFLANNEYCIYDFDLTKPENISEILNKIELEHGKIGVYIQAAGTLPPAKRLHLCPLSELRDYFEINFFGIHTFLIAAANQLKKHSEGIIIAITTAGVITDKNTKARGIYSPAKFAIQGTLTSLKEELKDNNIKVYSIAPGVMSGGLNKNTPTAFLDMVREKIPNKTLMENIKVAEIISLLCSGKFENNNKLTILLAPESDL